MNRARPQGGNSRNPCPGSLARIAAGAGPSIWPLHQRASNTVMPDPLPPPPRPPTVLMLHLGSSEIKSFTTSRFEFHRPCAQAARPDTGWSLRFVEGSGWGHGGFISSFAFQGPRVLGPSAGHRLRLGFKAPAHGLRIGQDFLSATKTEQHKYKTSQPGPAGLSQ